ncbi:MAG: type VI secretion IcmF C-terminal domain-containing protein, partial [Gammaproteobacteria bacterium]
MQTFAVIVKPTETEIDKVWAAQVVQPFRQNLANKFPFSTDTHAEATDAEIGQVFGPQGAIAKFFETTIGPLVVRRGDVVTAKTWANMGIHLSPSVTASFPGWIAPLAAGGVANAAATTSAPGEAQTMLDLQALGATGATEFTIEIDGQVLRWRGQAQPWVHMVWPNPMGVPGARVSAITPEGRTVVLFNDASHSGMKKMVEAAKRQRKDGGVFELSWNSGGVTVTANLKIVGNRPAPAAPAAPQGASQGFKRLKLPDSIIEASAPAAAAAPAGEAQ